MTAEKMIIITGRQYLELQEQLQRGQSLSYNIGTDKHPKRIKIINMYLDGDSDFTRNPRQFARINEDLNVQVKLEYLTE